MNIAKKGVHNLTCKHADTECVCLLELVDAAKNWADWRADAEPLAAGWLALQPNLWVDNCP